MTVHVCVKDTEECQRFGDVQQVPVQPEVCFAFYFLTRLFMYVHFIYACQQIRVVVYY